jgi:hypothetical protein
MNGEELEGTCLCGAVRYRIALPVKWCAHCHCTYCRRSHGAAFVTWVGVPREAFRWVAGEELVQSYASSEHGRRTFCGRCGTKLTFESSARWRDEAHVTRASLPPDAPIEPQAHAFFDDRAPWMHVEDRLPKLGGPTGTVPIATG